MTAPDSARVEAVARALWKTYDGTSDLQDQTLEMIGHFERRAKDFIAMADADAAWRAEQERDGR